MFYFLSSFADTIPGFNLFRYISFLWVWALLTAFLFFQAEDGIRDHCVTGVQTCALPILGGPAARRDAVAAPLGARDDRRRAELPGPPRRARQLPAAAGGARSRAGADEARAQTARMPRQTQLELVGRAGPGRVGAGGAATGVRPVVARVVQRGPARPAAAAPPRPDLRLDVAAARPAEPDQVEPLRRLEDAGRVPARAGSGRAAGAGEVERERLRARRRCDAAGAQRAQRRGRGAQLHGLAAGETGHGDRNTAFGRKDRFAAARADPCAAARAVPRVRRSGAIGAVAPQHDVVRADVVAQPRGDAVDQPLELGIGERVALAAALADRVMMVVAARVGGLEAGGAVDVEPVHQPQRREHLERAIDARQARRPAARRAQPVMDLLRAEAAVLALEQREHLLARAAGTVAGAGELAACVVAPGGRMSVCRHSHDRTANDNGLQ